MPKFRARHLFIALIALIIATPIVADWLVTQGGVAIETQGSWSIEGDRVVFTHPDGKAGSLPLASVDIDASHERTEANRVVLFRTEWCGYCQRAEKLLNALDVPYVAKDIERDRAAGQEFARRFGRSGIPVLDIDGTVIRGYDAEAIRDAVSALEDKKESEGEETR
ncbi:MAG: glutaredoxin domain-containing protein [Acidobacteriota bacterium]